jgi:hypothetical protein
LTANGNCWLIAPRIGPEKFGNRLRGPTNHVGARTATLHIEHGNQTHFTRTFGSTDMPSRNRCWGSCPFSRIILTGILWTTLT